MENYQLQQRSVKNIVIGAGAAGFQAAARLHQFGESDTVLVAENLQFGTSRNTGSDKQTYYKLSLACDDADSVAALAEQLFAAAGELTGEVVLHHAPADTSKLRGQHNANLRHWQARYPAGRLRLAADGRAQELRLECGGQEWCGRRDELELML